MDTNAKGESLYFICGKNIYINNKGKLPTLVTDSRAEVLDVSLAPREITPLISEWKILDDHKFSDNIYIRFSLDA